MKGSRGEGGLVTQITPEGQITEATESPADQDRSGNFTASNTSSSTFSSARNDFLRRERVRVLAESSLEGQLGFTAPP